MKRLLILASALLIVCACEPNKPRIPVDSILHNGKVVTVDASLSIVSAVAAKSDKIVAVGGEELLDAYRSGYFDRRPGSYCG